MKNNQIEQVGLECVRKYEHEHGRKINDTIPNRGEGFDLASCEGKEKIRYIEVKATTLARPSFRWLEPKEFEFMEKEENYWIYVVTDVGSDAPRVRPFHKDEIINRFKRITKYNCSFTAADFKQESYE